jgi:hypothetical protein
MASERAIKIAKREWGNIRLSLEKYGDIWEFDYKNNLNTFISGGPLLNRSLLGMDNDLPAYGYVTKEATHVFFLSCIKSGRKTRTYR